MFVILTAQEKEWVSLSKHLKDRSFWCAKVLILLFMKDSVRNLLKVKYSKGLRNMLTYMLKKDSELSS